MHEGQVLSWTNDQGEELLFTSSKATFRLPRAMRGGIPICFPQFGNCGSLEQHGFARNKIWSIDKNPPPLHPNGSHSKSFVDLIFKSTAEDLKCWPHSGMEPMGQESKNDDGFWGRRVQADGVCGWGGRGEAQNTQARGGVDGTP